MHLDFLAVWPFSFPTDEESTMDTFDFRAEVIVNGIIMILYWKNARTICKVVEALSLLARASQLKMNAKHIIIGKL